MATILSRMVNVGRSKTKQKLLKHRSSLPGLRTLDPQLRLPSTPAEFFRCTCLQSYLQTSPPIPQKSYPKFQNTRTTFQTTPLFRCSWRKVCDPEERRRKIIPKIVDTSFRCNALGQRTHSARTNTPK